jgi:hypothetical protein
MSFDASALANAVQRLRESVARCEEEPNDEQLRDGLIQRFEFTMSSATRRCAAISGRPRPRPKKSSGCRLPI